MSRCIRADKQSQLPMSRRCRRRLRGKSNGNNRPRCRVAPLLLGILAILALVGCSGSVTPTSKTEPVAAPTAVPTSEPTPAVIADPTSASQEDPMTEPVPTVDVPPTLSAPVKEPTVQAFPANRDRRMIIVMNTTKAIPPMSTYTSRFEVRNEEMFILYIFARSKICRPPPHVRDEIPGP